MSRSDLARKVCGVSRTIEIVGDAWTLMILRDMFLGARRFDDLQRQTGCSPHLLSQRLKRLEAEKIVKRRAYSERPLRHEYRLTERGRDLWPVVVALKSWGDRWLTRPGGAPIELTHRGCGRVTQPRMCCSECGDPMDARASVPSLSPAMARERDAAGHK